MIDFTMRYFSFFLRLLGCLPLLACSAMAEQTTSSITNVVSDATKMQVGAKSKIQPKAQTGTQIIRVGDKTFRAVAVNPKYVSLHWKNADGQAYGSFSRLKKALSDSGRQVTVLMNAGIYSANDQPAGLHVENGKVWHALNTRKGRGNFHLQPNGVFVIGKDGRAQIVTTKRYQQACKGREADWQLATQSGPMLLINGKINAKFIPDSPSVYTRNGVCTTPKGGLYFFATEDFPSVTSNLYQFARAAQQLGCSNALYLDGSISKLYVARENATFHFARYVGILSVSEAVTK